MLFFITYFLALTFLLLRLRRRTRFFLHLALIFDGYPKLVSCINHSLCIGKSPMQLQIYIESEIAFQERCATVNDIPDVMVANEEMMFGEWWEMEEEE